jgi:hypothetical protein
MHLRHTLTAGDGSALRSSREGQTPAPVEQCIRSRCAHTIRGTVAQKVDEGLDSLACVRPRERLNLARDRWAAVRISALTWLPLAFCASASHTLVLAGLRT